MTRIHLLTIIFCIAAGAFTAWLFSTPERLFFVGGNVLAGLSLITLFWWLAVIPGYIAIISLLWMVKKCLRV